MDRPRIKTATPGVRYRERADGSRQYMIWLTGTDGKPHWQNTVGGLKEAKRERAKIINAMAHGHKWAPSRVTFAEFSRSWLDEQVGLAPNTVSTWRTQIEKHLIPKLGQRTKLSDVDVNLVALFVRRMQDEGKKANSINTALAPLSRIMATAVRRGMVSTNPVTQLEKSERPKGDAAKMNILDTDEINLLLSLSEDWAPVFTTLIFTGLRISELLALRWEDIVWERGLIRVAGTKTRAARRDVVMPEFLQRMLAQRSLEAEGDLVFVALRGTAGRALGRSLRKAGITKRVRLHDLRHTFASILIHQGMSDTYIAEQMGHTSGAFTRQRYGHLFDGEKQRQQARERMESSFGQVVGPVKVPLVEPDQEDTGS